MEPEPAASSYRQVLADRRLALLLAGDLVSRTGDNMAVVALPLLTLRIAGRVPPALAIALVGIAPLVLPVALSFVVGLGRRRFSPGPLIVADCALRAVVFGGLGWFALAGSLPLWLLAGALLGGSALRLLANSGRRLLATGMAGEHGRYAVNGLLSLGNGIAVVAGPALGGAAVALGDPGLVLLVDGASFVVMLATVRLAVPVRPAPVAPTASGWQILRRVPVAARLFAVVFLFNFFYGPVEVALPLLVRGPLHAPGAALGEIWSGFGIGVLVGALATNWLRRLPQHAVLVGIVAGWGGCMVLLAVAPGVAVAVVAFGVGGMLYAPFVPVAYSLVQSALDPAEQQPVVTLWGAGSTVALPLGLALGGPLVSLVGDRLALGVSALTTLALVPVAAAALRLRTSMVR